MILRSLTLLLLLTVPIQPARAAAAQSMGPGSAASPETVLITEFAATGNTTVADEDGEFPDWLELHNAGAAPVDLEGWYLTDDPGDPDKWRVPALLLEPGAFHVVFASGKDRAVAGAELHLGFELAAEGEYLALVRPDGGTVAHSFDPQFPSQHSGLSYGIAFEVQTSSLIQAGAALRWRVPLDAGDVPADWASPNFDDTGWNGGTSGIGFEAGGSGTGQGGGAPVNVALGKPASQSSTLGGFTPDLAVNGSTGDFTHTLTGMNLPATWEVDLQDNFAIDRIVVGNRLSCCGSRLRDIRVQILDPAGTATHFQSVLLNPENALGSGTSGPASLTLDLVALTGAPVPGGRVRVVRTPDPDLSGTGGVGNADEADVLSLGEVEVFGAVVPPGYGNEISTDVGGAMFNINASLFLRVPFNFDPEEAPPIDLFTLRIKYDDGFIAHLNGVEVARRNAPGSAVWNSSASAGHPDPQALVYENIDLTAFAGLLVAGGNVLAIHGLNVGADDDDFLLIPELVLQAVEITDNRYFPSPTPGDFNSEFFIGLVGDTRFDPDRGFYDSPFDVTITNPTPDAIVRYTTDGSEPDLVNGQTYSGPITVERTTVLRAAAFLAGWRPSNVDTHSYFFLSDVVLQSAASTVAAGFPANWGGTAPDYGMDPDVIGQNGTDNHGGKYTASISNDLRALPTVSIVGDVDDLFGSNGIYTRSESRGLAWERAASAEMILPDGSTAFQENVGLRLQGGAFRSHGLTKKHSLRLLFKSLYGASKLTYPIFGEEGASTSLDTIVFRANSNDGYQWDAVGGNASYIRDSFARETLLAMGGVASHQSFVHLYINGHYWGLYNPVERPDHAFSATYFGGDKDDWDAQNSGVANNGDLGAWNEMVTLANQGLATTANYQRIQGNNPEGTRNPAYPNHLDVTNLCDYMIVNLYVGNTDWPHKNFWVGRDRSEASAGFKFYMWDSEWSMLINSALDVNRTTVNNGVAVPYAACRQNAEFRVLFGDRLHRAFFNGGPLHVDAASPAWDPAFPERNRPAERWAQLAAWIRDAMVAESARWGDQHAGAYTRDEHWDVEINQILTDYLPFRSAIVLGQFRSIGLYPTIDAPEFNQFGGTVPSGFQLEITHPNISGTAYYTLDGTDPRLPGGALSPSAIEVDGAVPVNGTLFVQARVWDGNNWSARIEATFTGPLSFSNLRVTEIMYNPPAIGMIDGGEYEFIELSNVGPGAAGLSGLSFSGIDFNFTNGTSLAAGASFVLVRNPARFQEKYPGVAVNGIYTGSLNNGGEEISLLHPFAGNVLSLAYSDELPWALTPDGHGFSLVPVDPVSSAPPDDPSSWRASALIGGSPGTADGPVIRPAVYISEIVTRASDGNDRIELHNADSSPADVGGWFLSDSAGEPRKFMIPSPMVIPAGEFAVFDETGFNPVPGIDPGFSLSPAGGAVLLFSGDGAGHLTGASDGFSFGASALDRSFGRYITSTGEASYPAQVSVTFGAVNSGPAVGPLVIQEIHYHPASNLSEFVEVRNISTEAVDLFEPGRADNAWRLNGAGFDFPPGTTLAGGESVLLVGTDPASFQMQYPVPGGTRIFGPLNGSLQNDGERLELQRPETTTDGLLYITVDEVRYNDREPWPGAADGSGPSLQRINWNLYGNDPSNWLAASPSPGNLLPAGPAPAILTQPADQTVVATHSVTFSVITAGVPPLGYKWRFNGSPIDGATGTSLTLDDVTPAQAGIYDLVVFNPHGVTISIPASLQVLIPADIREQPQPQAAPEGESATFSVVARSTTPITYQWLFNGEPIPGATGTSLTVSDLAAEDDGEYSVRVSDGVGSITSGAARLTVLIYPSFVQMPVATTVVEGSTVTLSVESLGTLPMSYRWRRGGLTLAIHTVNSHVDFLTLTNVTSLNNGLYSVILTNRAFYTPGVGSSSARLTVLSETDGDGMADQWEIDHGLDPADFSDAASDLDGDGFTAREEHDAGTDPNDIDSFLEVDRIDSDSGPGVTLHFGAVSNRTYTVQFKERLSDPIWSRLTDVVARATNRVERVTDPDESGSRYYRVGTPRQP